MRTSISALLFTLIIACISCSSPGKTDGYPMDKKYWTPDDYKNVNLTLFNHSNAQEELPNLTDPELAPVYNKIVDTSNITVVADDPQVGTVNKEQFTSDMFDQYKELDRYYSVMDRDDNYKYPVELVGVEKFGLCLNI